MRANKRMTAGLSAYPLVSVAAGLWGRWRQRMRANKRMTQREAAVSAYPLIRCGWN